MMEEDHCMYLKHSNNCFVIFSLYDDDILLVGNSKEMIDTTKKWLSSNFEMKDMSEASYVFGVKIIRDRAKWLLSLSQETYIKRMLERYHMQDSKPIDTSNHMQDSKLINTPINKSLSLYHDMCPKIPKEKRKCLEYLMPMSSVV